MLPEVRSGRLTQLVLLRLFVTYRIKDETTKQHAHQSMSETPSQSPSQPARPTSHYST